MSLQVVVSDCDMSDAAYAGGDVIRSSKVFTIEAPELEAFLREYEKDKADAAKRKQPLYFTRQVLTVQPTPLPSEASGEG